MSESNGKSEEEVQGHAASRFSVRYAAAGKTARGEQAPPHRLVAGIAHTPEGREWALTVAREFRSAGLRTELDLSGRSLGQQLSRIAKSGDYALILGQRESRARMVTLKDLRSGVQKELALSDAVREVIGSEPR